jgi:predicted transcriptional regulator
MPIQGLEYVFLFVMVIVIIIVIWRIWGRREKVSESVVLALIRTKNGTTLDDIILGAHISTDEAVKILRKLIARGVIKTENRDGKTIYKVI